MDTKIKLRPGPTLLAVLGYAIATPLLADTPGLAILMERMQTYTHKLQLSIEARNEPLVHFYLHELEETSEFVADNIEHYHEYPVGDLVREMLLPSIERLEESVESGEWQAGDARFTALIETCNTCHLATGHGAIRIAPATGNPFAQEFGVGAD